MWLSLASLKPERNRTSDSVTHILLIHCPPHQHCELHASPLNTSAVKPFLPSRLVEAHSSSVTSLGLLPKHYSHQSLTDDFRWHMTRQAVRPCMQICPGGHRADALISGTMACNLKKKKKPPPPPPRSWRVLVNNDLRHTAHTAKRQHMSRFLLLFTKITFSNQWMVSYIC